MNLVKKMIEELKELPVVEEVKIENYLNQEVLNHEREDVEFAFNFIKRETGKELNKEILLKARFQSSGDSDFINTFAYNVCKLLH